MSLRRLFSTHRSSADDTASQISVAPTYRSFPESPQSPPSYSALHTDFSSNPPQSSNGRRESGVPGNQPASPSTSVTPPSDIFSDVAQSHDRAWSQGAPSIMSGNSGDEHYWQNRADTSSSHGTPSHRPVFYRVYSPDGLIPTKQPVSRDDSSLGRTYAHFVPPPHTAATLKRHLVVREGIGRDIPASLFLDISATVPLEDTIAVGLLSESGPGSAPHDPLVLVLSESDASSTMITDTTPHPTDQEAIAIGLSNVNVAGSGAGHIAPVASATSGPSRPKGWIRVLANDSYKRPARGFISYQRGEILYASAFQEVNNYGVIERTATDLTLQRHGKIVMSFFTILKD